MLLGESERPTREEREPAEAEVRLVCGGWRIGRNRRNAYQPVANGGVDIPKVAEDGDRFIQHPGLRAHGQGFGSAIGLQRVAV